MEIQNGAVAVTDQRVMVAICMFSYTMIKTLVVGQYASSTLFLMLWSSHLLRALLCDISETTYYRSFAQIHLAIPIDLKQALSSAQDSQSREVCSLPLFHWSWRMG